MPDTLRAIILMVAGSFFFALGDLVFEVFASFLEFTHALSHATCEFREFLSSEKEKEHAHDDPKF